MHAFVFNVPLTAKVVWRQDRVLKVSLEILEQLGFEPGTQVDYRFLRSNVTRREEWCFKQVLFFSHETSLHNARLFRRRRTRTVNGICATLNTSTNQPEHDQTNRSYMWSWQTIGSSQRWTVLGTSLFIHPECPVSVNSTC